MTIATREGRETLGIDGVHRDIRRGGPIDQLAGASIPTCCVDIHGANALRPRPQSGGNGMKAEKVALLTHEARRDDASWRSLPQPATALARATGREAQRTT
jgi:hypothetical protein